jgi:hypothetical protein
MVGERSHIKTHSAPDAESCTHATDEGVILISRIPISYRPLLDLLFRTLGPMGGVSANS